MRRLLHPWRGQIVLITLGVLIFEGLSVIPPLLLQRIMDEHLVPGLTTGILVLALLYLAATVLAEVFGVSYLTAWVAQHALRNLRVDLFAHLQRLPLGYHDRTPLGDVISRCTADVDTVDTLFTTGVSNFLRLVQLVTTFAAMVLLSPRLALLAACCCRRWPWLRAFSRFTSGTRSANGAKPSACSTSTCKKRFRSGGGARPSTVKRR